MTTEEKRKIKSKLAVLGKKQNELIPLLIKMLGKPVSEEELSRALGKGMQPKHEEIAYAAAKIVTAWENERK